MSKTVLLSFVGMTDPMRDGFDGPLLHIVRRFSPAVVYLLQSAETEAIEINDQRYTKAICAVNTNAEIVNIDTNIVNVHLFDEFDKIVPGLIDAIIRDHKPDTILLNVSSGTPAMISALSIEAVSRGDIVQAVQVRTPVKQANINMPHLPKSAVDINEYLQDNFDHITPNDVENRCEVVSFDNLRRNNLKQRIVSLVENYEYRGALSIAQAFKSQLKNNTISFLEHAVARESLNMRDAQKVLPKTEFPEYYPIADKFATDIIEYMMVMQIRQLNGELPDFVLKMTPLLFTVARYYLKEVIKFDLGEITDSKPNGDFISSVKLKSKQPDLFKFFGTCGYFYGAISDGRWGFIHYLAILEYLIDVEEVKTNNDIVHKLIELREYEMLVRNKTAHEIVAISEEEILKNSKMLNRSKPYFDASMSSAKLLKNIRFVTLQILGNKAGSYEFIYSKLNRAIIESLN